MSFFRTRDPVLPTEAPAAALPPLIVDEAAWRDSGRDEEETRCGRGT